MYYFRVLVVIGLLTIGSMSCTGSSPNQSSSPSPKPANPAELAQEADVIQAAIKKRGEETTKAIASQKEVKEKISEAKTIELFTRETSEQEALFKLGEPDSIKDVKMEGNQQRVFYYNKSNFALWFWRDPTNKGPYQYRAAMSLNKGKFDTPIHNVFDEDELKKVLTALGGDKVER